MLTRRTAALAALMAACGPTNINITTTTNGEAGPTGDTSASTDASVSSSGVPVSDSSETGQMDTGTTTGAESTSASSSGGGSSSTGEPPPECHVDDNGQCACDGESSPGTMHSAGGVYQCRCGLEVVDLSFCGCPVPGEQTCICAASPCGPCSMAGAVCSCGSFVVPLEYCE